MEERTWAFTVTRTTTSTVTMTEDEIVGFLRTHNLDLPDVSDFEPNDWTYVIGEWTDQVHDAVSGSNDALAAIVAHRNAEVTDDAMELDAVDIDEDTSTEDDEAWRPAVSAYRADSGLTVQARQEDTVQVLVPDLGASSEWWR